MYVIIAEWNEDEPTRWYPFKQHQCPGMALLAMLRHCRWSSNPFMMMIPGAGTELNQSYRAVPRLPWQSPALSFMVIRARNPLPYSSSWSKIPDLTALSVSPMKPQLPSSWSCVCGLWDPSTDSRWSAAGATARQSAPSLLVSTHAGWPLNVWGCPARMAFQVSLSMMSDKAIGILVAAQRSRWQIFLRHPISSCGCGSVPMFLTTTVAARNY